MNQPSSSFDYCIVGAGPSGLTCAYELLKANKKVVLIERDDRVGGLAKSYNYKGHIFDTGPKRFHTDDPIVISFIDEVTKGGILPIGRSTKVYFLGRYFEWPLQSKDLLRMPIRMSLRCAIDLLKKRNTDDPASFHQYIRSKYGENLYQSFFKPYTQKFLRWDTEDIHTDWASTGINRTVIDQRVQANTLFDLAKALMLPQKIETTFLYPKEGGFGGFYEQLLELCQSSPNFELILSDTIVKLDESGSRINMLTRKGRSLSAGDLIWSGNLNDLTAMISQEESHVHYLNTVFYNLICPTQTISPQKAQWIYVSKGDSLISRITCMREFASYTCPPGFDNIICELTDHQQKPLYFKDPAKYTDGIIRELKDMKFIKDTKDVEEVHFNAVRDTYPIYHRRYKQDFGRSAGIVKKFSKRIHLLGRSGAFWYNNSDHSIRFAIEMASKLLGKTQQEFNYRTYFGNGH